MTTQDLAKTCYGRVHPSKVENLADIPTSELLKALRLTSVEEAEVEDTAGGNGEADEQ